MTLGEAVSFNGKAVLVCGGSDGIGYGVGRAFAELGASVTVTGTRQPADYDNDFEGLSFRSLNVQNPDAIRGLGAELGRLDVLVNCVGTVLYGKQEFERDGFEKILSINLTGAMQLSTELFPAARSERRQHHPLGFGRRDSSGLEQSGLLRE